MEKADFEPFRKMLALTAEQYGRAISPELTRFYFDGLSHLSIEDVRSALNTHVRNTKIGQFMPKISDLIRVIEGTTEEAAYLALAQVNEGFRGGSRELADPVARAVLRDMGGWHEIGMRQADEWQNFGSRDFVHRYQIYKVRGDDNAPGYLPGYFERSIEDKSGNP